jgi:hypothetical protein
LIEFRYRVEFLLLTSCPLLVLEHLFSLSNVCKLQLYQQLQDSDPATGEHILLQCRQLDHALRTPGRPFRGSSPRHIVQTLQPIERWAEGVTVLVAAPMSDWASGCAMQALQPTQACHHFCSCIFAVFPLPCRQLTPQDRQDGPPQWLVLVIFWQCWQD